MKHEVFVPVAAEPLRQALADPLRVARAVPGLQQDAGAEPASGRVKVRVGHSSITYRGTLRISGRDDGSYAVEGEATESRGSGAAKLSGTLRLTAAEAGTTLVFDGTVTGSGRIAELEPAVAESTGRRLVTRFAESLAAEASEGDGVSSRARDGAGGQPDAPVDEASVDGTAAPAEAASSAEEASSVFETEVPPPSLDPSAADEEADSVDAALDGPFDGPFDGSEADDGIDAGAEPPAEAAHARRTMIGRSAEEVDHAPPRGRYAPVPAPEGLSAAATLRWAAPAAALVVASVIVIGRALRRRR